MKQVVIALFSILIAINYSCESDTVEESTIMKEEADVYAVYINKHYITEPWLEFKGKPFDTIVVIDNTLPLRASYAPGISRLSIKPDEDTVKNFQERNGPELSRSEEWQIFIGRHPLNPLIKFRLSHKLISREEITQIFNDGRYIEFYQKYPSSRGFVRLSRVGFNKNMDQALFCLGQGYSDGGSEIFLVLLEKKDGEWEMVSRYAVSIS